MELVVAHGWSSAHSPHCACSPLLQVLLNVTVPQKSCQDAYEMVLKEFKKKVKVSARWGL